MREEGRGGQGGTGTHASSWKTPDSGGVGVGGGGGGFVTPRAGVSSTSRSGSAGKAPVVSAGYD